MRQRPTPHTRSRIRQQFSVRCRLGRRPHQCPCRTLARSRPTAPRGPRECDRPSLSSCPAPSPLRCLARQLRRQRMCTSSETCPPTRSIYTAARGEGAPGPACSAAPPLRSSRPASRSRSLRFAHPGTRPVRTAPAPHARSSLPRASRPRPRRRVPRPRGRGPGPRRAR